MFLMETNLKRQTKVLYVPRLGEIDRTTTRPKTTDSVLVYINF